MAQAERSPSGDQLQKASQKLKTALDALGQRAEHRLEREHGLSQGFASKVQSEAEAIALCERAMERLSMQYVRHLEVFRETSDANEALEHLEESEVIWRAETSVIREFDAEKSQEGFFQEMRQLGLRVLEDRLHEAATVCSRNASAENVALVIGILAVVDQIWDEMGFPPSYPERQKIRQTVLGFAD